MAERLEAKFPGKFKVELVQDAGTTGRLELTVFFNSKAIPNDKKGGQLVHSKTNGQGMGYDNWPAFEQRVQEALQANDK